MLPSDSSCIKLCLSQKLGLRNVPPPAFPTSREGYGGSCCPRSPHCFLDTGVGCQSQNGASSSFSKAGTELALALTSGKTSETCCYFLGVLNASARNLVKWGRGST